MPDFLAPYRVDILARSPEENVAILVMPLRMHGQRPEFLNVARALDGRRGWRFEAIFAEGGDASGFTRPSLDEAAVRERSVESETLVTQGHATAATLLAWSAVEAALRFAARRERVDTPMVSLAGLIKTAYTYGTLSRADYETLMDGLPTRNAVAHGLAGTTPDASSVKTLLSIVERLLSPVLDENLPASAP